MHEEELRSLSQIRVTTIDAVAGASEAPIVSVAQPSIRTLNSRPVFVWWT